MQNMAAPDYLLASVGKWLVQVCLLQLEDPTELKILDIAGHDMLEKLGRAYQSCPFRIVRKISNALSMSGINAILSVLPLHLKL